MGVLRSGRWPWAGSSNRRHRAHRSSSVASLPSLAQLQRYIRLTSPVGFWQDLAMPRPRSGRQYTLRRGDLVAEVASIGASLRSLQVGNRDLVLSFNAEEIRPLFRGCVLAPWPNRIAGGRWTYGGQEHQLAITEPARGHALHGLVAWLDWNEIDSSADTVSLGTTIVPQQGYPYQFDLTMRWSLEEAALVGRLSAVNAGSEAAQGGGGAGWRGSEAGGGGRRAGPPPPPPRGRGGEEI